MGLRTGACAAGRALSAEPDRWAGSFGDGGHRRRAGRRLGRLGGFSLALELVQRLERVRPPSAVDLGRARIVGRQHLEHGHAQRQQLGGGGVEAGKHARGAALAGQLHFQGKSPLELAG